MNQTPNSASGNDATSVVKPLFANEWSLIRERRKVAFSDQGALLDICDEERRTAPDLGPANTTTREQVVESATSMQDGAALMESRPDDLVGLALSGGGLRSALFNHGLLQALSHHGVLRYVDYLCSVSGGGYTAGHLMTYSKSKAASKEERECEVRINDNYHECADEWQFGRDPVNGLEDPSCLPGVGGYLNRTLEFFGNYCVHQLPVYLLYLSLVGTLATIAAIYYRSFDEPVFRMVFISGYGVRFGNELFIAFLPTVMIAALSCGLIAFFWAWDWSPFRFRRQEKGVLRWAIRHCIVICFLCAVTSVAVFLGNDLTKATSRTDVTQSTGLNRFALQLTIVAAVTQVLVFMGRDRLFKSEKSESSRWQKLAQSVIANSVVGILVFAMVHVMSMENIGQYTYYRDPALVTGEVTDFHYVVTAFETFKKTKKADIAPIISSLDFTTWAKENVIGQSMARKSWAYVLRPDQRSVPPSMSEISDEKQTLPIGFSQRYCQLALLTALPITWFQDGETVLKELKSQPSVQTREQIGPLYWWSDLRRVVSAASAFRHAQTEYLKENNQHLDSADLTVVLLDMMAPQSVVETLNSESSSLDSLASRDERLAVTQNSPTIKRLRELPHIKSRIESFSGPRQTALESMLLKHDISLANNSDTQLKLFRPSERVLLNRELLELSGSSESVLKRIDIASTPVVQPYDQRARRQMLLIWLTVLGVSIILTADLNKTSYLFMFYRQAIGAFFLYRRGYKVTGDTPVADLRPWERGLPMPIYLCAWLKPSAYPGAGKTAKGVAISPLSFTLWGDNFAAKRGSHSTNNSMKEAYVSPCHAVTLNDAVAVSGAAVAPNMTNNLSLGLLMDFFGARLGMWIPNPAQDQRNSLSNSPLVHRCLSFIGMTLIIATLVIAPFGLMSSTSYTALVIGVFAIVFVSFYSCNRGYPGMLRCLIKSGRAKESMIVPSTEAEKIEATRTANQQPSVDERILASWPSFFISDGGFYDYLGVTELLRRECDLIIVSDAGVNTGSTALESLAVMCERASAEFGIRFLDLDEDAPIEFERLERDSAEHVPQPYLAIRIKYPRSAIGESHEGLLIYAQMAITKNDPIEIQQIRNRFPSFPDEPTTNQFYTPEQVAAYRELGYHIGGRLANHMQRWSAKEIAACMPNETQEARRTGGIQPGYDELCRRLKRGFVQACFEEYYYQDNDVYGESIWRDDLCGTKGVYPAFVPAIFDLQQSVGAEKGSLSDSKLMDCARLWLDQFTGNADVHSRYLHALNRDVNRLSSLALDSDDDEDRPGQAPETLKILMQMLSEDPARTTELEQSQFKELIDSLNESSQQINRRILPYVIAHYTVVACAAQQLHRGAPHAIFQVGGRDKLCSLIVHLAKDLMHPLAAIKMDGKQGDVRSDLKLKRLCEQISEEIIHEVYELTESVFQAADELAVVTFVQCVCKELATLVAYGLNEPKLDVVTQAEKQEKLSREGNRIYRLSLDFRQLMLEKLQSGYRSRIRRLIAAYLHFLACPTFNHDAWREDTDVTLTRDLGINQPTRSRRGNKRTTK